MQNINIAAQNVTFFDEKSLFLLQISFHNEGNVQKIPGCFFLAVEKMLVQKFGYSFPKHLNSYFRFFAYILIVTVQVSLMGILIMYPCAATRIPRLLLDVIGYLFTDKLVY